MALQREVRATRGQRINDLIGDELEKDKVFWEHSTWNEDDSGNESYNEVEEEEKPDIFDSDFNETEDDESSEDEETELRKGTKRKATSKNIYREPVARKLPSSSTAAKTTATSTTSSSSDRPRAPKTPRIQTNDSENILSVKLRKSTTVKTLQHEQARIEASQRIKVIQRPPLPKREFSQHDLLIEAIDTELKNAKWLRSQQMAEEEKNLSDKPLKTPIVEKITYLSRRGTYNTITFSDSMWPEVFELSTHEIPENTCVITGLRARYLDPLTGYPYHNLEAYKQLKERFHNQQNHQRTNS